MKNARNVVASKMNSAISAFMLTLHFITTKV